MHVQTTLQVIITVVNKKRKSKLGDFDLSGGHSAQDISL